MTIPSENVSPHELKLRRKKTALAPAENTSAISERQGDRGSGDDDNDDDGRPDNNFGLDPGAFYRWREGFKLFGLKHSALSEAVNTGKLPPPTEAVEGGKAKGWFGFQIIKHRRKRFAVAEAQQRAGLAAAQQRALKGKQSATAE